MNIREQRKSLEEKLLSEGWKPRWIPREIDRLLNEATPAEDGAPEVVEEAPKKRKK